jgi:hypothetical protein
VDGSHVQHLNAMIVVTIRNNQGSRPVHEITSIELNIVKTVFQWHGVDEARTVIVQGNLRRSEVVRSFERCSLCLMVGGAVPSLQ